MTSFYFVSRQLSGLEKRKETWTGKVCQMCDLSALTGAWLNDHINEWSMNARPQTYWMRWMDTVELFSSSFHILHMHVFQVTSNTKILQCMRYWVWLKWATFWVIYRNEAKKGKKKPFLNYIKKKSFIQKTLQSHESQTPLIEQDGQNTVKKKWKINLSSMHAVVNKHIYMSSLDLHISMRKICSNSDWLHLFWTHSWRVFDRPGPKMAFCFFCSGLIISV